MANPITENMRTGTLGELFVQLRVLEFDIQAAPPLKDSGNDLIALKGEVVQTIQVKTTTNTIRRPNSLPQLYDLLALVKIQASDVSISWDQSEIYLIKREEIIDGNTLPDNLTPFLLNEQLANRLFRVDDL